MEKHTPLLHNNISLLSLLEERLNVKSDYKVWILLKIFSSWEIHLLKLILLISMLLTKELDLPKLKQSD